jgi:PD-(D/E)XK endonuclease
VLTTDQKGAIAESAIVAVAIKLGVEVYRPLVEGGRSDLIIEVESKLLRVQCKWAPLQGEVVVVRCYSTRRAREGLRRRCYSASEIDLIAAYCPELERSFLLSADQFDGRTHVFLRVAPSRNNQRAGINWAEDFAFEARLRALAGP